VYADWLQQHLLRGGSENNFILVPWSVRTPQYRDDIAVVTANAKPDAPHKIYQPMFEAAKPSSAAGVPHLVFPIGQAPYESKVTKRTEYMPVVAHLVGPAGSDLSLLNFAETAMTKAGWSTRANTGRLTFELAKNVRNAK